MGDDDFSRERSMLLDRISPTDYPAQHTALMRHVPEAIKYLSIPDVEQWIHGRCDTLLLSGLPKSGKTMMAAAVFDHIESSQNASAIAYVFCNSTQDTSTILAAILKQILQRTWKTRSTWFLYRYNILSVTRYNHHTIQGTVPLLNDIIGDLVKAFSRLDKVYILIDAIETCRYDVRAKLLTEIRQLQRKHSIKLLVTFRSVPEIIELFHGDLHLHVKAYRERKRHFFAIYRLPMYIHQLPFLREIVQKMVFEVAYHIVSICRVSSESSSARHETHKAAWATNQDMLTNLENMMNIAYQNAVEKLEMQLGINRNSARNLLWCTVRARDRWKLARFAQILAPKSKRHEFEDDPVDIMSRIDIEWRPIPQGDYSQVSATEIISTLFLGEKTSLMNPLKAMGTFVDLQIQIWTYDCVPQSVILLQFLGHVLPVVGQSTLGGGSLWATLCLAVTLHLSEIDSVARFLKANEHIQLICAAIKNSWVSSVRLERDLRRILHTFWKDLSLETTTSAEHAAAKFFQSGVRQWLVANHILNDAVADFGRSYIFSKSADFDVTVLAYIRSVSLLPNQLEPGFSMQSIARFLSNSRALENLKRNLQEVALPSFSSELDRILRRYLRTKRGTSIQEYQPVRNVISQLRFVNRATISISKSRSSRVDKWKCQIEQLSGVSWEWWPLQEPIRPLGAGKVYLAWQCICGDRRTASVPAWIAERVQELADSFQGMPLLPLSSQDVSTQRVTNASQQGTSEATPASSRPYSQDILTQTATSPSYSGYSKATPAVSSTSADEHPTKTFRFVFVGVICGGEYKIAEIDTSSLVDDSFFPELRAQYFKLKGFFRQYFSIWKFKHCDFVKFERFDYESMVPRGEELPEGEPDYTYIPKPRTLSDPMPPLHPHEFEKRFYSCYVGGKRHRHIFSSCHKKVCRPDNDGLKRIPKRNWPLEEIETQKRGYFWGLLARENISFPMVAFYNILLVTLPFVFWMCWLFAWDHSGDLQNASVPMTVVAALLPMFWFALFTNKDSR